MIRLGWSTFRLAAVGRGWPAGNAVTNAAERALTLAMLSTAAVAPFGTPARPVTWMRIRFALIRVNPPDPASPGRVSARRAGFTAKYDEAPFGTAACAKSEA